MVKSGMETCLSVGTRPPLTPGNVGTDVHANECRLAIGDFCCSLLFEDAALAQLLREYFDGFVLNGRKPDLVIEFDVSRRPLVDYEVPPSLLMTKMVQGNRFSFGSGLFEGSLHLPEKRCEVMLKEALLGERYIRIIDHFLYQVYYTLLRSRNPRPASFLVHACAVSRDGKGFVFSGPSGCGKSTIASLASQETVLNDETVIIEGQNGQLCVRSTPFNGCFREKKAGSAPLRALFLLEHARENRLRRLSKPDFAHRFVKQVVLSVPLLSNDTRSAFSEMLDFCSQIYEKVPVYQLGFRPDRSFWKCIQEENLL